MLAPGHAVELDTDVGQQRGRPGRRKRDRHSRAARVRRRRWRAARSRRAGHRGSPSGPARGGRPRLRRLPGGRASGPRARGGTWCRACPARPSWPSPGAGRRHGLTPDHARIEQAESDADVLGGDSQDLLGAADRVVELDALVPDGVPDPVGDGLDVPVAGVDEDDVQIAVGAQRLPPVAADGQEGQVALGVLGCLVRQLGEPGIGFGGVAAANSSPLSPGSSRSRRLRSRSDVSTGMAGT